MSTRENSVAADSAEQPESDDGSCSSVDCHPPESPDDYAAIRRVVAAALGSEAEAILVGRIRASPEYVPEMALVAEIGDELVGHVMISGAVIRNVDGERRISMLSPLAVVPSRQREGIGSALVRGRVSRCS